MRTGIRQSYNTEEKTVHPQPRVCVPQQVQFEIRSSDAIRTGMVARSNRTDSAIEGASRAQPTQRLLNAACSVLFTALMPKQAIFWAVP